MATQTKAVAKVEEKPRGSLVLAEDLDLSMVEGDTGHGVDDMSSQDVALPFLAILQSNSPQVNPAHQNYVEGATAGMFYNTVSQEAFDGRKVGLEVVPVAYERKLVEWIDRDKGGGWVRDYDATSDILKHTAKNDKGRPVLKDSGNFIVETAYHYFLVKNPETDEWEQCVFPMKSTALKVNKRLNNDLVTTRIPGRDLQAPRWLFPYHLTTVPETKNGNSWWSPKLVRADHTVDRKLYAQAKGYAELFKSGMLRRGVEPGALAEEDPDRGVVEGSSSRQEQDLDGDIPF